MTPPIQTSPIFAWVHRIYAWAITDDLWHGDLDQLRKAKINIAFAYTISIWSPVFAAFHYLVFKSLAGAISVLIASGLMLLTPVVMKLSRSIAVVGNYVTAILYGILVITALISGGHGQPPLTWQASIPMIAICLGGKRFWPIWILTVVGTLIFFYMIDQAGIRFPHVFNEEGINLFEFGALSALGVMITSFSLIYESEKELMLLEIRKAKDKAEEAVAQLNQTESQLVHSEKMSALGGMATGIAHEVNNPLAIISLNAQALLARVNKGEIDRETVKKKIDLILKAVDRASKITRGLKAFSLGSEDEELSSVRFSEIYEETMVFCQKLLTENSVGIRTSLTDDAVLHCKKTQISQVLLNLITNSLHAVEALDEKWVEIASKKVGPMLAVSITDSGKGIPLETQSKIFDPFFTTKPTGKGTGLGLSVSSRIILQHHGRLFLDREHPHTRFVLELPIQP